MTLVHVMQDWAPVHPVDKKAAMAAHVAPRPSKQPPLSVAIDARMKTMLEYHRIHRLMTLHALADETGIPEERLAAYESGRSFPDARDIDVLQTLFKTQLLP